MAYDEDLARRIRLQFKERIDLEEKKMFGGLCFMIANHMCCGIVKEVLMVRVRKSIFNEEVWYGFSR